MEGGGRGAGGLGRGQALRTSQTMIKMTMTSTTIPGITNVAPSICSSRVLWRAGGLDAHHVGGLIRLERCEPTCSVCSS
jgi:hypothetical protein